MFNRGDTRLVTIGDATGVLSRRLRIVLAAAIVPLLLFAVADLHLERSGILHYYGIKIAALVVLAAAWIALRIWRNHAGVVTIALVSAALMVGLSTFSAVLASEPLTNPLLAITAALATATLLPWGAVPQLTLVIMLSTSIVATAWMVTGTPMSAVTYPNVGVAIGLAASVFVASEFERSRRTLLLYHREQRRAERTARQLNEELEARVAERTQLLEEANRELAEQVAVRARAEAALGRSQAALTALIENATDAIWSIDRDHRVVTFNSAVRDRLPQLLGRPFPAGTGDGPIDLTWPPWWQERFERALAGEHFSTEHELESAGNRRHFLTSFNPIYADATVSGVAVFSADITERKRSDQAARLHREELTHVVHRGTMEEMAAGLAHEINQPLAAIAIYAQGCSRRLRSNTASNSDVLQVVDEIAREALRAGRIIRRSRDLIRSREPARELLDLNGIVAAALQQVATELREAAIAIDFEAGEGLPPVWADPIQIEQVLLNLMRNGLEAMKDLAPAKRLLLLRTAMAGPETVEIDIADVGVGISPADVEKIFVPFFSTKPDGLGMGLAISRTIIETHEGRIWHTDNPAGGVTFHVALPAAGEARTTVEAAGEGTALRQVSRAGLPIWRNEAE